MDIVNDQNKVIGVISKRLIYKKNHNHRIVHVLVVDPKTGKILVQKRASKKDFMPDTYCTSAGGHVKAGENYLSAAKRELFEELGIKEKLVKISSFALEEDGHKKFIRLFSCFHSGPFLFDPNEVSGGRFFAISQIKKIRKKHPQLMPCINAYRAFLSASRTT